MSLSEAAWNSTATSRPSPARAAVGGSATREVNKIRAASRTSHPFNRLWGTVRMPLPPNAVKGTNGPQGCR